MKKYLAVLVAVASLAVGSGVVGAHAQEAASSCTTPGTVPLTGIGATPDTLVPSQGRLISGYGRSAKAGGCKISLVCVGTDSGEPAREVARQQCVVVRDTLVKSGFTKADISTSRQNPGNSLTAGTVYFTAN